MISLNKAAFLTQGNPIRLGSLLNSLALDTPNYIAVFELPGGRQPLYSQVLHQTGGRSAHFAFFSPDQLEDEDNLSTLIDFLCFQAGEMGALNVLADIEESHPLFERFRRAGFCVFGWESIWRFPDRPKSDPSKTSWTRPSPTDENTVRSLYQTLVPPLVQNAEPFTNGSTPRLVYKVNGEIQAYVESLSGASGIYLVPVIHPSVDNIHALLLDLMEQFQGMGRPVYLQVRSYQVWLSDTLQELGAESTPRFALLVKHLAVGQLNAIKEAQRARSDPRQAEPTAPILNHYVNPGSGSDGVK